MTSNTRSTLEGAQHLVLEAGKALAPELLARAGQELYTHLVGNASSLPGAFEAGYRRVFQCMLVGCTPARDGLVARLRRGGDLTRDVQRFRATFLDPFFAGNSGRFDEEGRRSFGLQVAGSCERLLSPEIMDRVLLRAGADAEELAQAYYALTALPGGDGWSERLKEVLGLPEDWGLQELCAFHHPEEPERLLRSQLAYHVREQVRRDTALSGEADTALLQGIAARLEEQGLSETERGALLKLQGAVETTQGQWRRCEEALQGLGEAVQRDTGVVRDALNGLHGGVELLRREGRAQFEELKRLIERGPGGGSSVFVPPAERETARALAEGFEEVLRSGRALAERAECWFWAGEHERAVADAEDGLKLGGDASTRGRLHRLAYRARLELGELEAACGDYVAAVQTAPEEQQEFDIEQFRPEEIVGVGAFGVVFRCRSFRGESVVIKVCEGEGLEDAKTLRVLSELEHPNVNRVQRWETLRRGTSTPILRLELDDAGTQTLKGWAGEGGLLARGGWEAQGERALEVLRQLAEGLRAVHAVGIVHRDVKPENVVVAEGEPPRVSVIDFGFALSTGQQEQLRGSLNLGSLSRRGAQALGTLGYAAPEQQRGGGKPKPGWDVYAYGRTAFAMLVGKRSLHRGDYDRFPARLGDLLDRCTQEDPARRPSGFEEVLAELDYLEAIARAERLEGFRRLEGKERIVRFEHGATGLVFRLIPGGSYLMGSPEGVGDNDERPQHEVRVEPFLLSETTCTQGAWDRLKVGGAKDVRRIKEKEWRGAKLPVVGVSWEDARTWCGAGGLRLPSESEWEYACRAGTTSNYSFGDDEEELLEHGWFFRNSGACVLDRKTPWDKEKVVGEWECWLHEVGSKKPNPWGLHDMHGNVWEWCEDAWFDSYEGAPAHGTPRTDAGASLRVRRGGSWRYVASSCRSANRNGSTPGYRYAYLGFRPARSLP